MIKRIIFAACCACCSCVTSASGGVSSPVNGVADHEVRGTVYPPIVTWVDKPMTINAAGKIPAGEIGHFNIRLVGLATKLRAIVFADKCGVGGQTNLTFVNETDLQHNVGGRPQATITGTPTPGDGWLRGLGIAGKTDGLSGIISYAEGTDWYYETTNNEDNLTVTINHETETEGTPGVYSATYCMMQMII